MLDRRAGLEGRVELLVVRFSDAGRLAEAAQGQDGRLADLQRAVGLEELEYRPLLSAQPVRSRR